MKAYLAIKFHRDNRNRSKIEYISKILFDNGVKSCCIARDIEKWGEKEFTPSELMKISFQEILSSDFVIVDLTEKGVGLGIEAGYAYANEIPIITIAEDGADISNTLLGISNDVIMYKDIEDLNKVFDEK